MHKQYYFLSPVEVVKVTPQNMEEVAEWCGGKVSQIESRRTAGKMDKYVHVPTAKDSIQSSAYPGMYVTKRMVINAFDNSLKITYAVFRKDYFEKNYFDSPALAVDMTWERNAREEAEALKNSPVAAAFERAQERVTPKPAEPKKKDKHLPKPNINQLMGKDFQKSQEAAESEVLAEAIKTIQEIIPDAVVVTNVSFGESPADAKEILKGKTPDELTQTVEDLGGLFEKTDVKQQTKSFEQAMAELQERYDRKEITVEQFRAIRDSQVKPATQS